MGFAEVLTLIFVVMKCTGHLAWGWFWVFLPMLIVYGLALLIVTLAHVSSK